MSGTIKPDCIDGMDGMASFLGWPYQNRYQYGYIEAIQTMLLSTFFYSGRNHFLFLHMLKKKSEFCYANNDWVVFPVSLLLKMVNSMQNAGKVLSITLNIQESFYNQGKLGKAFFHLSTRKGFRSSRKGFVNLFPNLGKLLKILGKVSFQNFPKLPWERKGKGKLSVLPLS